MSNAWGWLARHGREAALGSALLAVVLIAGGLALGMASSGGANVQAAGPTALVRPTRHYLVGTVVARIAQGRAIVRGKSGRFFVVVFDKETQVRRNRQDVPLSTVRRGTRVIILGNPMPQGFHADSVTVVGQTPEEKLPASYPVNGPRRPLSSTSATPRP
jgi:hypothetical protein